MPLLFGLLLVIIGVVGTYYLVGESLQRRADVGRYQTSLCTITEADVESYEAEEGGTMYRPRVAYELLFQGRRYLGQRIGFMTTGSSFSSYAEGVLEDYPVGARVTCYFDPDDPNELVLDKRTGSQLLLSFIPLAFALVGAGILYQSFAARGAPKGEVPTSKAWRARLQREGELVLEPRAKDGFATIFVAAFAIPVVGAAVFLLEMAWISGSPGAILLALIFTVVAAGVTWLFVVCLLSAIGPRVKLTLDRPTVPLGETVWLRWRVQGWTKLNAVSIDIVGQEESTYTSGTDELTDTEEFYEQALVREEPQRSVAEGRARVDLPASSMHSFDAGKNRVVWLLKLEVDVDWWPDLEQEYELGVAPQRGRAR